MGSTIAKIILVLILTVPPPAIDITHRISSLNYTLFIFSVYKLVTITVCFC